MEVKFSRTLTSVNENPSADTSEKIFETDARENLAGKIFLEKSHPSGKSVLPAAILTTVEIRVQPAGYLAETTVLYFVFVFFFICYRHNNNNNNTIFIQAIYQSATIS